MDGSGSASSKPVPVHVGHEQPSARGEQRGGHSAAPATRFGRRGHPSPLQDAGIDWACHRLEPRWLDLESSDCAAALDPSIFHGHSADEFERFLAGVKSRKELALVITTIGDANDATSRSPLSADDTSILLPGAEGFIAGKRLPTGGKPSLAPDLSAVDRDLGLRLLTRPDDAPWWSLWLRGTTMLPGAGGPAIQHQPAGHLEPILIDGLGQPVVAAWVPASGDQRWYVIPGATPWDGVLDWMVQRALPAYVPGALRRARSPHALDPSLQTPAEAAARRELDDLEADYAQERRRLEAELQHALAAAEPIRNGLLYGTGADLENAVAAVLDAAGFATVHLDEYLGDTTSADLLATYGEERRLVEVKSAGGNAGEALVGQLERHLRTWSQLRPEEPVGGGVLIVNHQHRRDPDERSPEVYARPEFVAALTVPVLSTRELFDWWRDSDWKAIREALLASTRQQDDAPRAPTVQLPLPPAESPEPAARLSLWRRRSRRD